MSNRPVVEANFERLTGNELVYFASEACLIVRRPGWECGACRDVCPTGALSGGEWTIALKDEGCIGCGLCAAACPTGALRVEGCAPRPSEATGARIVVECCRVAEADRAPDAVAVPCLGGLTTPDLLHLVEKTEASVVLADHGWCASCPVSGRNAPWQFSLDETRGLLGAIDARLADVITVERIELPTGRAKPIASAFPAGRRWGRRELLRRLVSALEPEDPVTESRRVVFGRGLVTPVKRARVLAHIGALAADLGQDMPAKLMPAIEIADGCDIDGLCAAICPTGALCRDENEDTVSLRFDAALCIACGECQRACPSKTLRLRTVGDGAMPEAPTTLVQRRTATCASCGDSFVPAGDERTCAFCTRTTNLMRELVQLKQGVADVESSNQRRPASCNEANTWG
jgi:Fe-S-cluster-containing hydrogenase component 2